jgi:ribonuclease HI
MIIYTDGACSGNGKAKNCGGFGVVVMDDAGHVVSMYSKASIDTTNNREELKAILYAFLNYGVRPDSEDFSQVAIPIVYSDSAYCVNTFNSWMFNWANNNWIKSDKKTPENLDLIQAYYDWY